MKHDKKSLRFNISHRKGSLQIWNRRWFFGMTRFADVPKHIVNADWQLRIYDIKKEKVVYQLTLSSSRGES
jgi:hypothetical protein